MKHDFPLPSIDQFISGWDGRRHDNNMVCPYCFELCRGEKNMEMHRKKCELKRAKKQYELQVPIWIL